MVKSIYEIDPFTIKENRIKNTQSEEKPKRQRKPKQPKQEPVDEGKVEQVEEEPKPKKPRKSKGKPKDSNDEEVVQEETPAASVSGASDSGPEISRPKKERTPAQIAAAEKRKETLRLKKEEQEKLKREAEEAERLVAEKKEAQKAARKEAALKRKLAKQVSTEESTEQPKKKRTKKVKTEETDDAPGWFKNYVKTIQKREQQLADQGERSKVGKEVKEAAMQQWNDGIVRDKIADEISNHQKRMHSMIFPGRSF